MQEKYDIIVKIGHETYIHNRITFEAMKEKDWNKEIIAAITQAEYDNKD